MRLLSVVVVLLACSCTRGHPVEKAIWYGGGLVALVTSVVLGIVAECLPHPENRGHYDRMCGLFLLAAFCSALMA